MIEFFRLLGAGLMLMLPVTLCIAAGILYWIGLKLGIFEED